MKKITRRALSVVLSMVLILSCFSAGLPIIASAFDWVYVEGEMETYTPVSIYVQQSGLTSGQTYMLGINSTTAMLNTSLSATTVTRSNSGQTAYYTSEDGGERYTATNYYVTDETNTEYENCEFLWNGSTLYNAENKQYLTTGSSTSTTLAMNSSSANTWSFSSSRLSTRINSTTYYLRYRYSAYSLNSGTNYTDVTPYQKITVYKKTTVQTDGGYYIYNGQSNFDVRQGGEFNESVVLNAISVLYKETEDSTDYRTLTINDPEITLKWNETVNTEVKGVYTAAVKAEGQTIATISVNVTDEGPVLMNVKNDPSTSDLKSQFPGVESDDGKILTDKTVRYNSDEFSAFATYEEDEFSIALSALGQSYKIVETEEIEYEIKIHPDVVFVLDVSGSMGRYNMSGSSTTRAEGTAVALNSAINKLMESDPETRIGIVCYGSAFYPNGLYLPIDTYTLPAGDTDYVTFAKTKSMGTAKAPAGTLETQTIVTNITFYVYEDGVVSTENDTSKARFAVGENGAYTFYRANSTTAAKTGTVGNNGFVVCDTYGLFRSGNAFYLYSGVSAGTPRTGTVSSISTTAKNVCTVNGVTYTAQRNSRTGSSIYINKSGTRVATLTSSANTYTDSETGTTIKFASTSSVTYSYNEYTTQNISVPVESAGASLQIATSGCLKNSDGTTMPITSYTVNNDGTFTQAGLKAAENMFAAEPDRTDRIPVVVLISDGTPTFYNTDFVNVPYMNDTGSGGGNGTTGKGGNGNVNNCTNQMGYLTIRTAMSVKQKVNELYPDQEALFYSIGPGVDYLFGQTVLDPSEENLEACVGNTTTNEQAGNGTPDGLRSMLIDNLSNEELQYVDFADWSMSGNLSTDELNDAFKRIVTSLIDIPRPIKTVTETAVTEGGVMNENAAMVFTDTIGEGMVLRDVPVVRYNTSNYRPTSKTTSTVDGKTVESYSYNYAVSEVSTGKVFSLKSLVVEVITDADGNQTVRWIVPPELVPIVYWNEDDAEYKFIDAIRLIYKVGIEDRTHSGTYYSNSTSEPATAEFTPSVGNPYYYRNEMGTDGKMHSTLKTNFDINTVKTQNSTGTLAFSSDVEVGNDGNVNTVLGNNGVETLQFTQLDLTKIWDDGNNITGQRPDHISIQVYRNGVAYGEPRDIYETDCEKYRDSNGNDVWHIVVDGLPYNETFVYTIDEIEIPDHNTYIQTENNATTITNSLKRGTISYELYLVDKNGNPVDENGNRVTFENRTEMSELVEVTAYIHTTTVIDLEELEELLPDGYYIYNPDTSYTEKFEGAGSTLNEAKVNDDSTGTTKVFYPTTAQTDSEGNVTGLGDYSNVRISFAIAKMSINPDVVVLDYGKTILSSPLDNDAGDYVINGLLTTPPQAGTATKNSVKLNNGVAAVETGSNTGLSSIVPVGNLIVKPFAMSGTTYMYPATGETSTENNTSLLRYSVTNAAAVTKYEAGSTSGTPLATLADGGYVLDGDYVIYRSGNYISLVSDYKITNKGTTVQVPTGNTYYDLDGTDVTLANELTITGTSRRSATTVGTLPDGAVISASVSGTTIYIYDSSTSNYYNGLASSGNNATSVTLTHTLAGFAGADGNDIVISYTATRDNVNDTSITVTYTGYTVVEEMREETNVETTLHTRNYGGFDTVIYSPFRYMSSIDRVYYYVSPAKAPARNTDCKNLMYSTITFIPATTVYYEDDFGGSAENGGIYIKYTGDWYSVSDDNSTGAVTANTDTNDRQDRGEVGQGHTPYGYDSSYDNSTKFSNGSAAMVTGSVDLQTREYNAYAEFSFTGTGFDLISRTDLDCGMISAYITDADGNYVSNVPVINKGVENLYQIPVISYTGLDYGTYNVVINVNAPMAMLGITGSTFYLDAIRIYDPMGLESSDNPEFDEANAAYLTDKEANAYIASIRDFLIQTSDLDVTEQYGAVYVDTISNDYNEGGMIGDVNNPQFTDEEKRNRSMDPAALQNFELIGPNEEVYLSPGYGVGFAVESTEIPESVQLEIKIPKPINNGSTLTAQTYGKSGSIKNLTVNSATEMFYDITDAVQFTKDGDVYRATVVLSNGISGSANEVVAITNIKMTYADGMTVNSVDSDVISTASVADTVNVALKASTEIYLDVFDTVYVQHQASIPNYDIVNAQSDESVSLGETVTVEFNTAKCVDDVKITDENGEAVKLETLSGVVDEEKIYSDDYMNAKTWTATFKADKVGEAEYTVQAAGGEGETASLAVNVKPAAVAKLSVVSAPTKTKYNYGEEIDTTGLVLEAEYTDGTVQQIRSGYTLSTYKADHAGNRTVKVSFSGAEASFRINVKISFVQVIMTIFGFGWLWKK